MDFKLVSTYKPQGDQGRAIEALLRGVFDREQHQVLLGVTGSGKTFTMAKVIEAVNRPTPVMAHNKTLAAQLYHEFKNFFPHNAVEYFVSYYDYYQPEAYVPAADLYIEKEATINDELDKLRLSATRSLFERRDALIVASVSCIYGLGSPEAYYGMMLFLEKGQKIKREDITRKLVDILYERTNGEFRRGTFRVRGDVIEVFPTYDDMAYRIELWGDEISSLTQTHPLYGTVKQKYVRLPIYPKTHYVMKDETRTSAVDSIKKELAWWEVELEKQGRVVEAQRIHQRTMFDLEMIRAMGYCHGIENYSRHFTGRLPGEPPPTLLDYFPRDFLMFIDESHQTIPQLRGMYAGDRSRKETLVEYGFRMPSALDNRPLTFEEWEHRTNQLVYVSATPGPYELTKSAGVVVEQIIRPTGLIDPPVEIRPVKGQIDDLLHMIRDRVADKKGFLRSAGSLIQTMGRCARNLNGRAILYADRMTDSMKKALDETNRRRAIQQAYNEENGITPESIIRPLDMTLAGIVGADYADLTASESEGIPELRSQEELDAYIGKLDSDIGEAAKRVEFEKAAKLRDTIKELRTKEFLFA